MTKPSNFPFVSGTEVHWLKNGRPSVNYYESVNEQTYTATRDDGCSWTRITQAFAPTLKWDNCEYASGTQEIISSEGSPWPLNAMTEFQYTFSGKYAGDLGQPWRSVWRCHVESQVRVKVPAGEYDTYKLICEDDWTKRTYWISPLLGHHVAFEDNSKIYISGWYLLELVRVVKP